MAMGWGLRPQDRKFEDKYPLADYIGDPLVSAGLDNPRWSQGLKPPSPNDMTLVQRAQYDPEFPWVSPASRSGAILQEQALRNARLRSRRARGPVPGARVQDPMQFIPPAFRQAIWGQY